MPDQVENPVICHGAQEKQKPKDIPKCILKKAASHYRKAVRKNRPGIDPQKLEEFVCKALTPNPVGKAYYESFVNLPGPEMKAIVWVIMKERMTQIDEILFRGHTFQHIRRFKILDEVNSYLSMLARGWIVILEPGKIGFVQPDGDPPDIFMENMIEEKIKSFEPVIKEVFFDII